MKNKRIVILGGGESGVGAALLAISQGHDVLVSDRGSLRDDFRKELDAAHIPFEENGHTKEIQNADIVIKSPGIPENAKVLGYFREKNIPIISEIEFAYTYCKGTIIAITGANGKTTTTLLTEYILETAGLNAIATGNIGYSFSRAVMTGYDYYVVELSSFQLDGIKTFRPHIAIITNITPDHLDRYNYDFSQYAASKFRITMNQSKEDHLILCADDPMTIETLHKTEVRAKLWKFTFSNNRECAAYTDNHEVFIAINKKTIHMTLEELALQGRHNVYNSMAASVASRLIDIRKENIKQCLSDFQNTDHRLQKVATIHGITFINDSKATNVNAAWFALESQAEPVIWIAGGIDKGNDYNKLHALVKEKVAVLICLGKDNTKLVEAFIDDVEVVQQASTMEEAVMQAYQSAHQGETVLLSPACASFDLFENYEDRGYQFIDAVKNL